MSISQPNHNYNLLIERLSKEVEANLKNEQFGVEELAEIVGISRSHLHRKLQEATGQSVSQFIREYRLQRAIEILENEEITASEVAYQVGFGSATYFSKSFTDFYGYPPGEIKKRNNKNPSTKVNSLIGSNRKTYHRIYLLIGVLIIIGSTALFYKLQTDSNKVISSTITNEEVISIAILPFKGKSSDTDNQYFADGVMVAILNNLSKIGQLKVRPSTSVEKYRNTTKTISEIAKELGVAYILEGSSQKYGNEIRITAQLINVGSDNYIWSQDYTRSFADVFRLQSEIAEKVVEELGAILTADEKEDVRKLPTKFPEAYNYYMLANFQFSKSTKEGINKSISFFEKAIEIDSNYVEAYIGLARVWSHGGLVWGIYEESEAWSKSKLLFNTALELDPTNVIATSELASGYFYYDWNFNKTSELFSRSKIMGVYSERHIDFVIKIGDLKNAEKMSDQLLANEFSNSIYHAFNAEVNYLSNKRNKALTTLDEGYELFDDLWFLRAAAKLYYAMGEIEKSKSTLKKHNFMYPDRNPIIIWLSAVHQFHDNGDSHVYINALTNMYNNNSSGSPAWFIALYYSVIGDSLATFEWLEKSFERHEVEMTWLKMEPLLASYKNDPRYQDLLSRMQFPK